MGGGVDVRPELQSAPLSEYEQDAIRLQLERLLAHPLFKHSKRSAPFLRYIVEHTLADKSANLKERALGIEIFERSPNYDTTSDPVVRVTAGEIRKRIAQYYFEPGHETELRIELPPGSYLPEFRFASPQLDSVSVAPVQNLHRNSTWPAITATVAVLAIGLVIFKFAQSPSALDQFWGPVLNSSTPVLLSISNVCRNASGAESNTTVSGDRAISFNGNPVSNIDCVQKFTPVTDANTLTRIGGFLQSKGKSYDIRGAPTTSYSDLRDHAAVLIGGFNNPWTMRLCDPLRFSFKFDVDAGLSEITDRKNTSGTHWGVPMHWQSLPENQVTEDYALISRLLDPTTDQIVVVAAGIGGYGTTAAGEFLTNAKYMEALIAQAPRNWTKKNLEVILATEVINGNSGPPRIVAVEFW